MFHPKFQCNPSAKHLLISITYYPMQNIKTNIKHRLTLKWVIYGLSFAISSRMPVNSRSLGFSISLQKTSIAKLLWNLKQLFHQNVGKHSCASQFYAPLLRIYANKLTFSNIGYLTVIILICFLNPYIIG